MSKADFINSPVMYLRDFSKYPNHMEILIPPEYYIAEYKIQGGQLVYKIVKR